MKTLKLIKYGHEYCSPCRTLKPILKELETEFSDKVEFVDKDTYAIPVGEVVDAGIKAVPTLILIKDNSEVWRNVGLLSKDAIKKVIENNL